MKIMNKKQLNNVIMVFSEGFNEDLDFNQMKNDILDNAVEASNFTREQLRFMLNEIFEEIGDNIVLIAYHYSNPTSNEKVNVLMEQIVEYVRDTIDSLDDDYFKQMESEIIVEYPEAANEFQLFGLKSILKENLK